MVGSSNAFGAMHAWRHVPPDADLHIRVEALEQNLNDLHARFQKECAANSTRLGNMEVKLEQERHTRTTEVRQLRGEMR
jgi:anti-sigma-K factor RskA